MSEAVRTTTLLDLVRKAAAPPGSSLKRAHGLAYVPRVFASFGVLATLPGRGRKPFSDALLLLALAVMTGCSAQSARMAPSAPAEPASGVSAQAAPNAAQEDEKRDEAPRSPYGSASESGADASASPGQRYAQPPAATVGGGLGLDPEQLWADLTAQEAKALAGGTSTDCATACKALKSMQRATGGLCELGRSSEKERERCQKAQERVRAARERVRASCGQCQDGPSLDPSAPIESEP